MYKIGEVSQQLMISSDTLRYYEKIDLLPPISRTSSGIRLYNQQNISQIKFIKKSQAMGFSLNEIAQLLTFRKNPQQAKREVRQLAHDKLKVIEEKFIQLQSLKNELTLLVNLCCQQEKGCPIITKLDTDH